MLNMYMFHRYTYAYVQRTGLSCCGSILWYSKFQRMYKSCGALAGATVVAAHALLSDDPTSSLPSFPLMFPTNMTTTPQKQNSGCRIISCPYLQYLLFCPAHDQLSFCTHICTSCNIHTTALGSSEY